MKTFTIGTQTENDGGYIAEVFELPGAIVYGKTREEAVTKVKILTLRVIADMIEHEELSSDLSSISFIHFSW